jgi:hypothetical protein
VFEEDYDESCSVCAAVTVGGNLARSIQNAAVRALERLTRLETNCEAQHVRLLRLSGAQSVLSK